MGILYSKRETRWPVLAALYVSLVSLIAVSLAVIAFMLDRTRIWLKPIPGVTVRSLPGESKCKNRLVIHKKIQTVGQKQFSLTVECIVRPGGVFWDSLAGFGSLNHARTTSLVGLRLAFNEPLKSVQDAFSLSICVHYFISTIKLHCLDLASVKYHRIGTPQGRIQKIGHLLWL